MRSYERQPDFGDADPTVDRVPVEWEYVATRRRPGAPGGSLPVRVLLINEGVRLVDRRGPRTVSVAECARRIGVSKGAPYVWFADAEDFRLAVAASLTSDLADDLASGPRVDAGAVAVPAAIARLSADVGAVVRNWVTNGMGLELIFARGGPASQVELSWAAQRFLHHFCSRVHDATACGCRAGFGMCWAQRGTLDAVLALCDGFAALARTGEDAGRGAESAGLAAARLMSRVA